MFAPYDDYYNMRLGVLYMLSDSPTDAATAMMHAIKLSPRNAIYHCLIADIYAHNIGDDDMAWLKMLIGFDVVFTAVSLALVETVLVG